MADWLYSLRVRLMPLFGGLSLVIGAATTISVEHAARRWQKPSCR